MCTLLLGALALLAGGCSVVVRGSPLSGRPGRPDRIYLSTGGSPRPYRTLGFVQVQGYGVEVAGLAQVGDAALDGTLQGALVQAASQMGGDGVIHIEFLDTNPSTPVERAQAAAKTVQNLSSGSGGVETKNRVVIATGEVIQFLE
ncbi:MAG: hypothetical protein D6729_07575 [Deltaproteobacteria bacterium]|nr:MAG: hypothetical protein D6729_07575 [Deltaproteobacteria bacterium]